jgi:deazaflavin-dependent oxidoreductase (nitroreductase family)
LVKTSTPAAAHHARVDKRRLTTALARYAVNPVVRRAIALGLLPRGYAIIETTGRRSGQQRQTPVGYAREGDAVWLVSEHGRRAAYVRNLEADARVRVRLGRDWHHGRARVVPDDDARARLGTVGTRVSRLGVRAMGTDPVSVRIDLET